MNEIKKSKKSRLPDGRGAARSHKERNRHRVRDGVRDTVRARLAAGLGIYQKDSGGEAREEGEQAEDRLIQKEAEAAHREEEDLGLHRARAGRDDSRLRCAAQEGRLHAQGGTRRLHVHRVALQDHHVRADHVRRGRALPEVRRLYREGVCRVPEGGARTVRKNPDDNRRRAAAQAGIRQGRARRHGRPGAGVFPSGMPGPERD